MWTILISKYAICIANTCHSDQFCDQILTSDQIYNFNQIINHNTKPFLHAQKQKSIILLF